MGKTIRFHQSHKQELDATKPHESNKIIVRPNKRSLIENNLSSRKINSKIKQRSWPLGSEKKKGHVI